MFEIGDPNVIREERLRTFVWEEANRSASHVNNTPDYPFVWATIEHHFTATGREFYVVVRNERNSLNRIKNDVEEGASVG